MGSSFFAQNSRRLSGFSLRPGHSLFSWDGSEPSLGFHATPQLPQWPQSSGVLLPQPLSIIKPCPDVDGYYPMVRLMTSVYASFCASLHSSLPFLLPTQLLTYQSSLPSELSLCGSLCTLLAHLLLPSNPCIPSCPFPNHVTLYHCFFAFRGHSKTAFSFLYCYCCFLPEITTWDSTWPSGS